MSEQYITPAAVDFLITELDTLFTEQMDDAEKLTAVNNELKVLLPILGQWQRHSLDAQPGYSHEKLAQRLALAQYAHPGDDAVQNLAMLEQSVHAHIDTTENTIINDEVTLTVYSIFTKLKTLHQAYVNALGIVPDRTDVNTDNSNAEAVIAVHTETEWQQAVEQTRHLMQTITQAMEDKTNANNAAKKVTAELTKADAELDTLRKKAESAERSYTPYDAQAREELLSRIGWSQIQKSFAKIISVVPATDEEEQLQREKLEKLSSEEKKLQPLYEKISQAELSELHHIELDANEQGVADSDADSSSEDDTSVVDDITGTESVESLQVDVEASDEASDTIEFVNSQAERAQAYKESAARLRSQLTAAKANFEDLALQTKLDAIKVTATEKTNQLNQAQLTAKTHMTEQQAVLIDAMTRCYNALNQSYLKHFEGSSARVAYQLVMAINTSHPPLSAETVFYEPPIDPKLYTSEKLKKLTLAKGHRFFYEQTDRHYFQQDPFYRLLMLLKRVSQIASEASINDIDIFEDTISETDPQLVEVIEQLTQIEALYTALQSLHTQLPNTLLDAAEQGAGEEVTVVVDSAPQVKPPSDKGKEEAADYVGTIYEVYN